MVWMRIGASETKEVIKILETHKLRQGGRSNDGDTELYAEDSNLKNQNIGRRRGYVRSIGEEKPERQDFGAIMAYKASGDSDNVIIDKILSLFKDAGVSKEYITPLLAPKTA